MKHILAILVLALLFSQSSVFAETKEIIAEGTYNMGDGETPTVAESRALLQAKRTAVEEAGTYVESYSKTRSFQLTVDEIQVLASGIMEVEVLEKKRTVVGDGFNFWIKIKARVSTDKMEEMAKRVKEKSVVEDYKKIQEVYDKSQKEIEELKKQLAGARGENEKKRVEAKIADDERLLQAIEWVEKGYALQQSGDNLGAAYAYSKAIEVEPKLAMVYNNRGIVYNNLGDIKKAIADYDKAIELDTKLVFTYKNRGDAYHELGNNNRAITDYNRAIELDPKHVGAYINRGIAYSDLGDKKRAIADWDKTIELDPKNASAYKNRAVTYSSLGDQGRAMADLKTAARLGHRQAQDWLRKQGIEW